MTACGSSSPRQAGAGRRAGEAAKVMIQEDVAIRGATAASSGRPPSHARIRSVTIPRAVVAIALMLVAAFGTGCDPVGPSACTLIGCAGLVVEVTGAPGQTPVTVVVT